MIKEKLTTVDFYRLLARLAFQRGEYKQAQRWATYADRLQERGYCARR